MGPDEHVSREEFLITIDHLMAVISHQQKALQLLLMELGESDTLTADQVSHLGDEIAASAEYRKRLETFERLVSFEEIRAVFERYRDLSGLEG